MPNLTAAQRNIAFGIGLTLMLLTVLFIVWHVRNILLILFLSILFALLIDGLARVLRSYLSIRHSIAVLLATVCVFGGLAAITWAAGPHIGTQLSELQQRLQEATETLESKIKSQDWMSPLLSSANAKQIAPSAKDFLGGITGVFSSTIGAVANLLIILLLGLYLAFSPQLYVNSIIITIPAKGRQHTTEILEFIGHALRWWLVGRILSMTLVGVLTTLGLYLIGIPLYFALGFIAALLSFVPYIGPIIAAIPAVLIGFIQGFDQAANVILVYIVVQSLESYFITPLIQRRVVSLPPAALLSAQLLMGALLGTLGVVVAAPLTLVFIVLVQVLYVRDQLGEDVNILGQ
ncbi:MAG: AI-2E family transporter [Gammaproteobacteria bacterium]|jgi:predicted PurR-regulated permease PerM